EFRLWVKSSGVTRLGVRLADASDQCHQSSVALKPTEDWQELVLNIRDLVGGEHWGGANDGRWHGPAKGLGLNVDKSGAAKKTLWIDDVEALRGPVLDGHPTALAAVLTPSSCRPGYGVRVTFRWDAEPLGRD